MDAASPVAVRTQYQYRSRPGRRAIVVTDLASLAGPVSGPVELPLRLFWSSPDRTFDLGNPFMRRWLYQTVLREASPRDKFAGWPRTPQAVTTLPDEAEPADPRAGRAKP